ncbi:hypothetical protein Peur_010444 [Populus x canadensis]
MWRGCLTGNPAREESETAGPFGSGPVSNGDYSRGNKGSRSPSTRGLGAPMPTPIILKIGSYWKRMKIFIPLDSKVEIIPLLHSCPAPTSPIYTCHGSSSQAPTTSRVEDIFFNPMLDHAPICFPILNKKGKRIMEIVL